MGAFNEVQIELSSAVRENIELKKNLINVQVAYLSVQQELIVLQREKLAAQLKDLNDRSPIDEGGVK